MKEKIINNKKKILVLIIFIFAIIIRVSKWPGLIYDVNVDEAMTAINARSIAYTGKDIYGTSFPVYFESWLIGGQSAFPTYLIAICIKIFGYNMFSIRLPILLFSIISIYIIYKLSQKMFNDNIAIIVLLLTAINPWQILQSQWCLDCNLFPHIILIAIYLLYIGLEEKKNKYLYFSVIFFALSMYSYGIALYFVPLFLLMVAIYAFIKRDITIKQILICFAIFLLIAVPILLMYIVNFFGIDTIKIFGLTIQKFEYVLRKDDMLIFSKNIFKQAMSNFKSLNRILIFQNDELVWNQIRGFGTIYLFSVIFVIPGMIFLVYFSIYKKEKRYSILLLIWIIVSIIDGILINNVNINRINIIWYVLIIINAYGIYYIVHFSRIKKIISFFVALLYVIYFSMFIYKFYTYFPNMTANSYTFSNGLVQACSYLNGIKENKVILSTNVYNSDKQYVFMRFELEKDNESLNKEELLAYYFGKDKEASWFNYITKYQSQDFEENTEINDNVYLILMREVQNIINIDDYDVIGFNQYVVLRRK